MLYFSLVQSQITYDGIVSWGGAYKNALSNLEVLQKWILKIIFNRSRLYSSDRLFKESGVLDIRQLFSLAALLDFFKYKNNAASLNHQYLKRNKNAPVNKKCRKTIGQRSHKYIQIKIFNQLPIEIKQTNSYFVYKKLVKNWLQITPRNAIHLLVDNR